MLPGIPMHHSLAADIFRKIEAELGGTTAFDWEPVALEDALTWLAAQPFQEYYLYYRHPVHEFKDRCSRATKAAAFEFLRERFSRERGEGVDLYLTPTDLSIVFAGNHDGDFFRVK